MTNRRWVCPQCGAGANGPQRPRRDDVRRYCFPCSTKTGRLVERTCPALDRQRETKAAARTVRTKQRSAADKLREDARWQVGPFDFRVEQKRIANLPTLRDHFKRVGLPTFTLRHSASKSHSSGRCMYGGRIIVTAGTNPYEAWAVLLHEMVHHALGKKEQHTARFYSFIRSCAKEAWPEATFDFSNIRKGWSHEGTIGAQIAEANGADGWSGRSR